MTLDEGASKASPPTRRSTDFDLRQQAVGGTFTAVTADGVPLTVGDPVVSYTVDPDQLVDLDRRLGAERIPAVIAPLVSSAIASVLASYRWDEMDNPLLSRQAQERITATAAARALPYPPDAHLGGSSRASSPSVFSRLGPGGGRHLGGRAAERAGRHAGGGGEEGGRSPPRGRPRASPPPAPTRPPRSAAPCSTTRPPRPGSSSSPLPPPPCRSAATPRRLWRFHPMKKLIGLGCLLIVSACASVNVGPGEIGVLWTQGAGTQPGTFTEGSHNVSWGDVLLDLRSAHHRPRRGARRHRFQWFGDQARHLGALSLGAQGDRRAAPGHRPRLLREDRRAGAQLGGAPRGGPVAHARGDLPRPSATSSRRRSSTGW